MPIGSGRRRPDPGSIPVACDLGRDVRVDLGYLRPQIREPCHDLARHIVGTPGLRIVSAMRQAHVGGQVLDRLTDFGDSLQGARTHNRMVASCGPVRRSKIRIMRRSELSSPRCRSTPSPDARRRSRCLRSFALSSAPRSRACGRWPLQRTRSEFPAANVRHHMWITCDGRLRYPKPEISSAHRRGTALVQVNTVKATPLTSQSTGLSPGRAQA